MKKFYRFAAVAVGVFTATAGHAQSQPTIIVTPWIAPNSFGSPSFDPAAQNQFDAIRAGASSAGTPGTPTYYQAITGPVAYGANIATNFNSWMGVANPGAPFQNELGNRIQYGIQINGNGQQFSISQLSRSFDGNGVGDEFDIPVSATFQYSPYGVNSGGYVGILKGADGVLGTADDQFVTSGPSTQLVDGLIGRGSGVADAVYCGAVDYSSGDCGPGNQGYIDDEIARLQGIGFTQLTANYALAGTNATGSATVVFAAAGVPEPATWAMMIMGFGFVGASLRRRRGAEIAALA